MRFSLRVPRHALPRAASALVLAFAAATPTHAHEVPEIPAEVTLKPARFRVVIRLDAVYIRDNLQREIVPEQSDLAWLEGLGKEAHAAMKKAAEEFLRTCLQVATGDGEPLSMRANFPDFIPDKPQFEVGENGIPFLRVAFTGAFLRPPEVVQIRWYAEDAPPLATMVSTPDHSRPFFVRLTPGQTTDVKLTTPPAPAVAPPPPMISVKWWLLAPLVAIGGAFLLWGIVRFLESRT